MGSDQEFLRSVKKVDLYDPLFTTASSVADWCTVRQAVQNRKKPDRKENHVEYDDGDKSTEYHSAKIFS